MRQDPEAAAEVLRQSGLEPLAPYPGADSLWPARCSACDKDLRVRFRSVRDGRRPRHDCTKEDPLETLRDFGYEPQGSFPGNNRPWLVACERCRQTFTVKLIDLKKGHRRNHGCTNPAPRALRTDPEKAAALLRSRGLEPLEPFHGADKPWKCLCLRCRREISVRYSQLSRLKIGCRYCAGKAVDPDEAISDMRACGFEPLTPYPGTHTPWPCRCMECGRESTPRHSLVRSRKSRCKYCARRALPPGEPERTMRERGLEPLEPYPGLHKNWKARCLTCGTVVQPHFSTVKHRGSGCYRCNGTRPVNYGEPRKVWREDEAAQIMREAGLTPLDPYPGALKPWRCRCNRCRKEVAPRFAGVRKGKRCRYCFGRNAVHPDTIQAVMDNAGLEPLEPFKSALSKWLVRCASCEAEFKIRYNSVQQGGGCPSCAARGLDWSGPCIVYVLTHTGFSAHKIGIAGIGTDRLRRHERDGWKVFKTLQVQTGFRAFEIEQAVLAVLREDMAIPAFLSAQDMPQAGWTETLEADAIALSDLWTLVLEASSD